MKKEQRVLKNREFQSIISSRKMAKSHAFVFYFLPRSQDHARLGISVGKKLGNAVLRNQVKRQTRALADALFDFEGSLDGILIVRPPFLKMTYQQRHTELEKVFRKAVESAQKGTQ